MAVHTPHTRMVLLCLAGLMAVAHCQEALTFKPTNATAPYGTQVTGAPTGFAGTAATTTTLGPCVLRTLHTHAATELLYVVKGSLLSIQFAENGSLIASNLDEGKSGGPRAVVYPAGRTHLQYNPTCKAAQFIAFFPVDVPGIKTVNLPVADLNAAIAKAQTASPNNVNAVGIALAEIQKAATSGPVPAGYAGKGPFTPPATGTATFAFPTTFQGACLKRCKLV